MDPGETGNRRADHQDEARAVRFLLGKAALFLLLPAAVAVLVA